MAIRYGRPPAADFGYDHVRAAIADFIDEVPDGELEWRKAIAAFVQSLYSAVDPAAQLFVDKTPRNHCFAPEIVDTFPDAPILFLWRHPLSVVASINSTWGNGRWKAYFYRHDLYAGHKVLVDTWRQASHRPNVTSIQYEQLVQDPLKHWPAIFAHFGLEFRERYLCDLPQLRGVMGDKSGAPRYRDNTQSPVDQWHAHFSRPLRRKWAARYLRWIGEDNLSLMGYAYTATMQRLTEGPSYPLIPSDIFFMGLEGLYHRIEPALLMSKFTHQRDSRPTARR